MSKEHLSDEVLSVRLTRPELIEWYKSIPPEQSDAKIEGALAAGVFVLNLVQASAGEEQMSRFFRPVVDKMDELGDTLNRIIRGAQNSQRIGEIGEEIVVNQLRNAFPADSFDIISREGHQADILAAFDLAVYGMHQALIEVKLYTRDVERKELDKFRRDLREQQIPYGIMISLSSKLSGITAPYQLEETTDYTAIFVSRSGLDGVNLITATALLKAIILYHVRAAEARRISSLAVEGIWDKLHADLEKLRTVVRTVQAFRRSVRDVQRSVLSELSQLADEATRAEVELQHTVDELTQRIAADLRSLPTTETLALPQPASPDQVCLFLSRLEQEKDKRSTGFRRLVEIAHNQNLEIIIEPEERGGMLVLLKGHQMVASTSGTKDRLDVVFAIEPDQQIELLPRLETVKDRCKVIVCGADMEEMFARVEWRIIARLSQC